MILKYSQLHKTAKLTGQQANKRALKFFGEARQDSLTAFITPQGKQISGEIQGRREYDHRQIASEALGEESANFSTLYEMLNYFMQLTGNIRVISSINELNIQVQLQKGLPTKEQLSVLERMAKGKPVIFDITKENGDILTSGEGKYFNFLTALQNTRKQERELNKDVSTGSIPRQLQPLADFVDKHFNTLQEYRDVHFESKHPLHPALRKAEEKTGLGVTKIWDDFGFNSHVDFFEAVKRQ